MKSKLKGLKEKNWGKELEEPIFDGWKQKKVYRFNKNSKKKVFSIDTPPPYINAPVHVGQATTYVLMDMFARFHRMLGYEVLFPLGLDKNGLPIEMATEKRFKVRFNELPREKFIELCEKILAECGMATMRSFLRLGISFNSWEFGDKIGDVYETDSRDYRALTQDTFVDLWRKGLIYEDERINNYCPGCRTTIADAEIEYKELATYFNDVIFRVKETNEEIVIGTTRPELICTCGMVIFNPDDERYKHLGDKTTLTPLFNKEVPIRPHSIAEIEKGTGLVMMCSAGDTSDIRFFREMNIEPVIAIDADGKMNKNAGFLQGLGVQEARERIINSLKEKGLLVKQENVLHKTPICSRSEDPIEFIAMPEFYLKQLEFKDRMVGLADQIEFFAPESKQILLDWVNSINIDWPISRRRCYATEIPLWYCKRCNMPILPDKYGYYKPWKEKAPVTSCRKCGSKEFRGEERVFDTWFDSSISPLFILGYKRDSKFFKKNFPCSLRPQGYEIVRTWLYYTILKCYLLTGRCIFSNTWINQHVVDDHGKKMSKSKGNVIDPEEILNKFGAESFRLWCAVEGDLTKTTFRCSFERVEGAGKTLTKLWNVARFISNFPKARTNKINLLDKWIINELNKLVEDAKKNYSEYNFHTPVTELKHFLWEEFASHYLELVKVRAYNENKLFSKQEQDSARYTLHYCLDELIKILAPVVPFITYKIYKELNNKDVHMERIKIEKVKQEKLAFTTKELVELNSAIWKAKKDKGLSLKAEVKRLELPKQFKGIVKDIKATHNVKELKFGEKILVGV